MEINRRQRSWVRGTIVLTIAFAASLTGGTSPTQAGVPEPSNELRPLVQRVDRGEEGIQWASIAGNGRTAFARTRADIGIDTPPGDGSRLYGIDVVSGATWLVTSDDSFGPKSVSRDGRQVAGTYKTSRTGDLAVTVVDAFTGEMRMVDVGMPLSFIREIDISADGATMAFTATVMEDGSISPTRLFIADTDTGTVIEPLAGSDGNISDVHLSGDGTVVAFTTFAENLAMPAGYPGYDAVIYDRVSGDLELAVTTVDGGAPNGDSLVDALSDDGETVLLRSAATNLGEPVADGERPLYAFDRSTGVMTPIELNGLDPDWSVAGADATATKIAVAAYSTPLAIIVDLDLATATSLYPEGIEAQGDVLVSGQSPISLSADGTVAVFVSGDWNIGPDGDRADDAFIAGAPPLDASADVFVPPARPLPPLPVADDLVRPPTISDPDPPPPGTSPEPTIVEPDPEVTDPEVTDAEVNESEPNDSTSPTRPVDTPVVADSSIDSIEDLRCRLADAFRVSVLPCDTWPFATPLQALSSITAWIVLAAAP